MTAQEKSSGLGRLRADGANSEVVSCTYLPPSFPTPTSTMLRSVTTAATANPASVRIPITTPFTQSSLSTIRSTLANAHAGPNMRDAEESHAAVLVPLCNVDGRPGVLLEVRGKLRTHSGEVRYVYAAPRKA